MEPLRPVKKKHNCYPIIPLLLSHYYSHYYPIIIIIPLLLSHYYPIINPWDLWRPALGLEIETLRPDWAKSLPRSPCWRLWECPARWSRFCSVNFRWILHEKNLAVYIKSLGTCFTWTCLGKSVGDLGTSSVIDHPTPISDDSLGGFTTASKILTTAGDHLFIYSNDPFSQLEVSQFFCLFLVNSICTLWLFNSYDIHSLPWFFDGPNRNRWALPSYKNGLDLSMAVIPSQDECYAPSGVMLRPDDTWHWGISSIPAPSLGYFMAPIWKYIRVETNERNGAPDFLELGQICGANPDLYTTVIYDNICICRYIYLFGLIYRWFLSTSNIYIYHISLRPQFLYIYIYIRLYIYIYGFKFSLNPVQVKWLCLSSQLSTQLQFQRALTMPLCPQRDAAENNGLISDSEDLVDPKYKTVWGQGFRTP